MTIRVSSDVLRCVIAAAAETRRAEICGLLWGTTDRVFAAQRARNVSPNPEKAFEIDPVTLVAAHRRARRLRRLAIVGHFHSHPSGQAVPSPRDADAAVADGALWLIVAGDIARLWRAVERGSVARRFDPVAFAIRDHMHVDRVGTGVRMHVRDPDRGSLLLESIA